MLRRKPGVAGIRAAIGRLHPEVQCPRLDAGAFEQRGQRHAGPGRRAHRAEPPLHAGRRWQREAAAAVAGALRSSPRRCSARMRRMSSRRSVTGRATSPSIVSVHGVETSGSTARWLRTKNRSLLVSSVLSASIGDSASSGRALRTSSRDAPAAALPPDRAAAAPISAASHAAHQRSGGRQSERERLASAQESIVHGTSD